MNGAWREFYRPDIPWWSLVLRAIIAYAGVLILLRLAGKRQVGNLAMPEFVALLLISNAVQNAMNGGDNSLVGGMVLAIVLIALSTAFAYATYHSPKLERLVQGRPTLLIHNGKLLHHHLAKELLSVRELKHLLRKQDIHDIHDIQEAVLESDGYISVIKKSEMTNANHLPRTDLACPQD